MNKRVKIKYKHKRYRFYKIIAPFKNEKNHKRLGVILLLLSIYCFIAFVSFLFTWKNDQSEIRKPIYEILKNPENVSNSLGKLGAIISDWFIFQGFGISSFILIFLLLLIGLRLLRIGKLPLGKLIKNGLLAIVWISLMLGHFLSSNKILGGTIGSEINLLLHDMIGSIGSKLLLLVFFILVWVPSIKINLEFVKRIFSKLKPIKKVETSSINNEEENIINQSPEISVENPNIIEDKEVKIQTKNIQKEEKKVDVSMEVTQSEKEETLSEKEIKEKLKELGEYDPKLELSSYKIPGIDLLKDYGNSKIKIDKDELESNKRRIVDTLANYNIGIDSIKATIGPTVTLYEIVPEAGIRISKIKNLGDDIALSLAAEGIRIIAPIPGKGTIGIEVPNQQSTVVSMLDVLSSDKFQNNKMELPIAFGKTISNETYVADLAKMPHLLMAGATGQGKSVGLNVMIASLLYKKHPSQIKFVLVDPKKVELSLFNRIERHYLAKLPDSKDAIIIDTKKVINTINSLCREMDGRYEICKKAHCRNIVEYNNKFISRKLNPNDGHRFLPYIILIIDEFADLIMTAGKEIETPIARLAQLARAVGIHLVVATQRPSVNVITGLIKANFPARVAFKVTSKIDSRTILDASGAEKLIGKGDMLIANASDLIRLQCAFIDTPEVNAICDFIGSQRGYPDAHILPEYIGKTNGIGDPTSLEEKDAMFEDAAKIVIQHQSGSTSLIQRRLKLGYNRAGRIIDQLEAANIVGPFEGSKARQVLVRDEIALKELLNNLNT